MKDRRHRANDSDVLGHVLPIYFVVDESRSMEPDMDTLNEGMRSFLDALHSNPMAAGKIRFAVIGFSDTALMHLEPSDLRNIYVMPLLQARNTTMYGAAFRLLRKRVETDTNNLKHQGYKVFRPTAFFLTDGAPNDADWRDEHSRLMDPQFRFRPNILSFGFGGANESVIREIATSPRFAFQAEDTAQTGEVLHDFLASLTQSIIQSGLGVARGEMKMQMDKAPAGFVSLALDEIAHLSHTIIRSQ